MLTPERICDVLVEAGALTATSRSDALARQATQRGSFLSTLEALGLVTEARVVELLSRALRLPAASFVGIVRNGPALAKISLAFAETRQVFPLAMADGGKTLILAMADPTDLSVVAEATRVAGVRISPRLASAQQIETAIVAHYRAHAASSLQEEPEEPLPTASSALESLWQNQLQASRALDALLELLSEKGLWEKKGTGYFSPATHRQAEEK